VNLGFEFMICDVIDLIFEEGYFLFISLVGDLVIFEGEFWGLYFYRFLGEELNFIEFDFEEVEEGIEEGVGACVYCVEDLLGIFV